MGVRCVSYYEQVRCQVLLDMMHNLLRRERTEDNARQLHIVHRRLPERFQSGVSILTDAEQASGRATGWARTTDQNGSVPGWAEVGPTLVKCVDYLESEESYDPESYSESVEAETLDETVDNTVDGTVTRPSGQRRDRQHH